MKKVLVYSFSIMLMLSFIYACGSKKNDDGGGVTSLTGSVYYPNAGGVRVCADENDNGYPDDALCVDGASMGNDEWAYVLSPAPTASLVAGIKPSGRNASGEFINYLTAPSGYETISMFTTFVQTQMAVKGLDEATAINNVKADLKLPASADPKIKPADDTAKIINVLSAKTAATLQDALNQLQNFDVTNGLVGLLSVIKDSLAAVADAIIEAAANGTPPENITVTLPNNLQDLVDSANSEADNRKGTTFPYTLRRVQTGVADGKLYAFLGYQNETNDQSLNHDILIYNIATGKWEEKATSSGFQGYSIDGYPHKTTLESTVLGKDGKTLLVFSYVNYVPTNVSPHDFSENLVVSGQNSEWKHIGTSNKNILPQDYIGKVDWNIGFKRIAFFDSGQKLYTLNYLNEAQLTQPTWTSSDTSAEDTCYQEASSYHLRFSDGKKIFLGDGSGQHYCTFNIVAKTWETKQKIEDILPPDLNEFKITAIVASYNEEGKGYILFGEENSKLLDKYVEFDMSTLTWGDIKTAKGTVPPIAVGTKIVDTLDMGTEEAEHRVYNGKIYVVGGKSGFLDKAWVFDTATGAWKRI